MQSRTFDGRTTIGVGLVLGVAGVGLYIGGLFLGPEQTLLSYLTAYTYALSLAVGALLFLTMTAAMGATWPLVVRRIAEGIVAVFPLLALLAVPILCELPLLYRWMRPESIPDEHTRSLVLRESAYLNRGFFIAREAIYFSVFIVTAELMRAWSLRQDANAAASAGASAGADYDARRRMRVFAAAMFGPVLLATSFMAIDLVESTAPAWTSSIFPLYYAAGGVLGAVCLAVLLAMAARAAGALALQRSHHYAFGRTLFTLLLVWAYLGYFQFMLIWIADKPAEAIWYVHRGTPGWYWMSIVVIFLLHFAVPFLALVPYRGKRSPACISAVAAWLLVLHFFDVYWMIHPNFRSRFDFSGMDVAMVLGVCGLCAAFGAWRMRGCTPAAIGDPVFERALEYRSI